jgi:flagellar L-ring protein FlgH
MTVSKLSALCFVVAAGLPWAAHAQTSSLGAKARHRLAESPEPAPAREEPRSTRNAVYDEHSWIVTRAPKPKKFRPGDLLTVIIRESKQWQAESDLQTKNQWDVSSQLNDFVKLNDGALGAAQFASGHPNIDFKYKNQVRNKGDSSRDDKFTTRMTAKIIDVKPNGLLVIEGRARIVHDQEITNVTITGTCRKEDVTADNTILSTEIADKDVVVQNDGALKSTATRGWILRLIDLLKPF